MAPLSSKAARAAADGEDGDDLDSIEDGIAAMHDQDASGLSSQGPLTSNILSEIQVHTFASAACLCGLLAHMCCVMLCAVRDRDHLGTVAALASTGISSRPFSPAGHSCGVALCCEPVLVPPVQVCPAQGQEDVKVYLHSAASLRCSVC